MSQSENTSHSLVSVAVSAVEDREAQLKLGLVEKTGSEVAGQGKRLPKCATPEYKSWAAMKNRCLNKNADAYDRYGGRGITICEQWLKSFDNFLQDMGPRPVGTSIERRNNDLGYFKENCYWATPKQQTNNQRSNHRITVGGETLTISQWAERLGVHKSVITMRILTGWSEAVAATEPLTRLRKITIGGECLALWKWAKLSGINRKIISRRIKAGWDAHAAVFTPIAKI